MDRARHLRRAYRRALSVPQRAQEHLAEPVDSPTPARLDALARDDVRLLADALVRQRLRATYRRFVASIEAFPRDQATINRLRAQLPRPISDAVFWDMVLKG